MIARVQQNLLEKGRTRFSIVGGTQKPWGNTSGKFESKKQAAVQLASKERQKRDYCKANNLCYYCPEPFGTTHLAKCKKRHRAHMNALVLTAQ